MTAFRTTLGRCLRGPSAPLVGIIVTLGVALLTLIPAADEYSALRERSHEVSLLLRQGERDRAEAARREQIRQFLERELQVEQRRAVSQEHAHRLRQSLVEYSREAQCHLRKVDLGPARVRQWNQGDHPLQASTSSGKSKKSEYLLEVRDLRLTLSGDLTHLKIFLEKLTSLDVQMNIQQLNLRSMDPQGNQIQLELVLQLFGVRRADQGEVLKS